MILPNNGKVVIIDDKPEQVLDLMAALSKEKIPFHYYKAEDGSDLPEKPLENIRLIFLDLMLITDAETVTNAQVIGAIAQRLKKILHKENGPYILIIWSTRESKYKSKLMKEFRDGNIKEYKPIKTFSMNKGNANNLQLIRNEIKSKMRGFRSFNSFLGFESIVNKSVGDITNDLTSIYAANRDWERNMQGIFFSLANAVAGKEIKNYNAKKILKTAYTSVSLSLLDTIEKNISTDTDTLLRKIEQNPSKTFNEKALLNTKLHLMEQVKGFEHRHNGNLYIVESNSHEIDEIMYRKIFKSQESFDDAKKNDFFLVELDVTPLCDYAQEKAKYTRLLPGVAFKLKGKEVREYVNSKGSDCIYLLCPPIIINGEAHWLYFDYRFLHSVSESQLKKRSRPKLRLKSEIVNDIQTNLSKHINRPGILSIS